MRYAVISDIHSNWEALESTFREIDRRKVDQIICLGDIVGYGANPSECLALICERSDEIVLGNHDEAVFNVALRAYFNPLARQAIEWTETQLKAKEQKKLRDFSPIVINRKANVTWAHGSVHEPHAYHYLFSKSDARPTFQKLETDFCFFGHTHIPSLFSEKSGEVRYLPAGRYELPEKDRYVLNPGSVGQPRDRNPELSFALFDADKREVELIRMKYDNQKAAEKIREAGLPSFFADRLL
jgi:predicted phosphodiesterase